MNEFIQFKKSRELGQIITDIFKFIRHNYAVLFTLIFRIAGPALVLLVLAYLFYMESTMNAFDPYASSQDVSGGLVSIIGSLLVLFIAAGLYYALLYGTVLNCVKSYVNNNGTIDNAEVISGVKDNFWGLVGLSILNGLIVGAGFLVCGLPGIYLGVVVITTYMIMVFEKRGATDSISYSFELIKGQWWTTFATLIVVWVIYYVVSLIFQIPQFIYFFIKEFTVSETYTPGDSLAKFDWIDMSLSAIGVIGQYLLQTFLVLASAFIYFNLNEKKNFTGTMERIESLGNREE
jgi:hypothetical protein